MTALILLALTAPPDLACLERFPSPAVAERTLRDGLTLHSKLLLRGALSPRERHYYDALAEQLLADLTPWALLCEAHGQSLGPVHLAAGGVLPSAPALLYRRQEHGAILFWRSRLESDIWNQAGNDESYRRRVLLGEVRRRLGSYRWKSGKMPQIARDE